MAVVAYDSFTDTAGTDLLDHEPDSGGAWKANATLNAGQAVISNEGRARANDSDLISLYHTTEPEDADYEVRTVLHVKSLTGIAGLVARASKSHATAVTVAYDASVGMWFLANLVNDIPTAIDTAFQSLTPGNDYVVRLVVKGTTAEAWVNGDKILEIAVTLTDPGVAGLSLQGGSDNTGLHLDEWVVEDSRLEVGRDASAAWHVRTTAGRDAPAAWHVRTTSGRDAPAAWNVRTTAGRDTPLAWNIADADVVTVGRDAGLGWNVRGLAGRDAPAAWTIRTPVGRDAPAAWTVRTKAGRDAGLAWSIRTQVGRDASMAWDVEGAVQAVGRDAALAWGIRTRVGRDAGIAWDLRTRIGREAALAWHILGPPAPIGPELALMGVTETGFWVAATPPHPGFEHVETQWRVRSANGAATYYDEITDAPDQLETLTLGGLTEGAALQVEARYRLLEPGKLPVWSDWSEPLLVLLRRYREIAASVAELWSDYACAGGQRLAILLPLVAGSVTWRADGSDEGYLVLADEHADGVEPEWRELIGLGLVVRVTDHLGEVSEWRIARIADGDGTAAGETRLELEPPLMDLERRVRISEVTAGGAVRYRVSTGELPATAIIDDYLLTSAARSGISWLSRGTVETEAMHAIEMDGWSGLQLANELAQRTGLRRRLRRLGDAGYALDLVQHLAADAPEVLLMPDRNLSAIERERDAMGLLTVAIPKGRVPEGGEERSGIEEVALEVTAVDGSAIEVRYPGDPTTPVILYDDQFGGSDVVPPLWLAKVDGTLTEILDTVEATQRLVLDDATDIAVGDYVGLRQDGDGTLLSEIAHPVGVQEHGRVVDFVPQDDLLRGERNWCRNPFFSRWEEPWPEVVVGRADGPHTSASLVSLQDLPPGYEIREGDLLLRYSLSFPTALFRIQDDAMVDEYGEVTVEVAPNLTVADGYPLYISRQVARLPEGWSVPSSTAGGTHVARRDRTLAGVLPCEADGAYSVTSFAAGGYPVLNLRGLAPGEIVQFGDLIRKEGGDTRLVALSRAVADAGGTASVVVRGQLSGQDGDALVIERPDIPADAGPVVWGIEYAASNPAAITPTLHIPYRADLPVIWFRVGMTFWSPASVTFGVTTGLRRPQLLLFDADSQQSVAQVTYAEDLEVPAATPVSIELRLGYQLTQPRRLQLWVRPPHHDSGVLAPAMNPLTFVRWTMATVGPDEKVPPIDGSHGNALLQQGLRALRDSERASTSVRLRLMDRSADPRYVAADETVRAGAMARIRSDYLRVDQRGEIVTYRVDLVDPLASEVEVDTRLPTLTRIL